MAANNLFQLLEQAALDPSDKGISVYLPGNVDQVAKRLTYNELFQVAQSNSPMVQQIPDINSNTVVLIHFDNHLDNLEWLWSVVAAGYLPAISTPFTNDLGQRKRHLFHLQTLLNNPVIITRDHLLPEFAGLQQTLNIWTVEQIQSQYDGSRFMSSDRGSSKEEDDLAVLMLTSGSTGNAKAVALRHGQILKAIRGKSENHGMRSSDTFLNWIGLDHVANLTEIHLQAMALVAEQVHVNAADLLASPLTYLSLVDKHRAAYSFAPNFFLASLRRALEEPNPFQSKETPDLCCLRALISGGEANVTETCNALTQLMGQYGAPYSFVRPGFGMTETCAGSIYNKKCPSYDLARKTEFTSLGSCIPGLTMRVVKDDRTIADPNEIGDLELSGPIIFKEYYNNPSATAQAFTADGWFITGDRAYIDVVGRLSLAGRAKESIIINGVKHFPQEIEAAIEDAGIGGIVPSYTAVFPHRPKGSQTEVLCVIYLPSYQTEDITARVNTKDAISEVAIRQCGARPYKVIPLERSVLPKTSLGKLSRTKIRNSFESGAYVTYEETDDAAIQVWRAAHLTKPSTETEQLLLDVFADVFEIPHHEIGVDTSIFELGASSVELFRLKTTIERKLDLQKTIAIITLMSNPTIRGLATALTKEEPAEYNAAVVLQPKGSKTPLWLVHPGVGEILIFLNLVKYITDRPIYALRSKGFDGEGFFGSVPDAVSTYHATIKKMQPEGPYAIAGYSYGATLAFEMTKIFEASGDEVKFLGAIDQPPHIKFRMRHSNWTNVVLTLAKFLEILSDEYADSILADLSQLSQDEALDYILSHADPVQLAKTAIDKEKLGIWASLALNNHVIAHDYEPSGMVPRMDVFYATPDKFYAKSREEWMENHLCKWSGYVESTPIFHEVDGNHNNMIRPVNVAAFSKTFQAVMQERGV